ncbi:PREDICTED: sugar transporter ERD6-like 18 isoform X2 [Tarenaya hassleriana]|uniref:sugar transporter ERD6-like 18 isoform X2 n=1 Tax=Tarenaya hassleriana TaxID=28532 RepID=UPI00053C1026|nr:PREDICTED: sugar transporter ERD6-like 18 isoform X2 [Tarenaya hassleriana]
MAGNIGRRGTMWMADFFCITGWLSIALAKDVLWLDFGRISTGIGLGLISYVVPVYIGEISPKHTRGAFTASHQVLQNCGGAVVYFFGSSNNWRMLAIIGALPCLLQVLCLFFVPESPRWLAKVGLEIQTENSLHRLRGKDYDISREVTEIRVMNGILERDSKSGFGDLFQKKYRHTLVVGIGLMLIQQFSGSAAVFYYTSTILTKAGFSVAIGSTILGLLMASAAGMGVSSAILGASFTLQKMQLVPELTPTFTFLCIMMYIVTFQLGVGGLPWMIMSEIFPMNIKVSAGTIVTLTSWLSGWLVTYTFNFMLEWSPQGTFYIFSVICGASLVFIWLLVPETKGLTLEEIQATLTSQPDARLGCDQ